MSSVKAILRIDKINAKGLAPLYLRSTHNRKSAFKALGIYIHPDDWDAVAEKVRKSKRVPNSTRINNLIAAQKLEVQNYLLDVAGGAKPYNPQAVKRAVSRFNHASFTQYAEDYLKSINTAEKYTTYKTYRTLLRNLNEYAGRELHFGDIDVTFLKDYYRIKIYNKTIYARTVEKLSPPENILRVEVAFHASGISKLGLPNTMDALTDRERFQMYADKFREIVYGIAMVDYAPDISGLTGKDLRDYYFMHRNQRVYAEYLSKIEGDKKRLAAERKKYDRINTLLASSVNLKGEFFEKFEAEIERLMTARCHKPLYLRTPRTPYEPTGRKRAPIRTIR